MNESSPGKPKKKAKKKAAKKDPPKDGPASNLRSRIKAMQQNQKKETKTGVVYDEIMLLHRSHRESHPERPERLMAVYLNLVKKDIWRTLVKIDGDLCSNEELQLVHNKYHV